MKNRRGMRRPRWFRPNWGTTDTRQVYNSPDAAGSLAEVKGNAPFQGDAGGRGLPLAELQRFTHIRTVGSVLFEVWPPINNEQPQDGFIHNNVSLGLIVVETDEQGLPKTVLPDPQVEADQDERWLWTRHRSFVTPHYPNISLTAAPYAQIDFGPPFEGTVDITQRRRMRNEENLFWVWRFRSFIYKVGDAESSDPDYGNDGWYRFHFQTRTLWAFN